VKLYYYPLQNFGNRSLNTWLWPQLLPTQLREDSPTLLVGIGSLLNNSLPRQPLKAVFSSGAGYHGRAQPDARWRVYCVRGPASARLLRLKPALAVTDGAVLVRTLGLAAPAYRYGASRSAEALQRLVNNARPLLSSDQTLDRVSARLQEKLEYLKLDFAQGRLRAAKT
jgi:hypothetical protein